MFYYALFYVKMEHDAKSKFYTIQYKQASTTNVFGIKEKFFFSIALNKERISLF